MLGRILVKLPIAGHDVRDIDRPLRDGPSASHRTDVLETLGSLNSRPWVRLALYVRRGRRFEDGRDGLNLPLSLLEVLSVVANVIRSLCFSSDARPHLYPVCGAEFAISIQHRSLVKE